VSKDSELIVLDGEIDMVRADDLHQALELFGSSVASHAVVDLSSVTFFGSEGVGLVAQLYKLALDRQGTVTLVNADRRVIKVLEISGLNDLILHERRYAHGAVLDEDEDRAGVSVPL
jgi:anti-anti-sigma factor